MSRDKKIEEMELARELCGKGEQHIDCFHCPTLRWCGMQKFARELYAKGYRKSQYVAEEIFAEIENLVVSYGLAVRADRFVTGLIIDGEQFTELKKKYTEGGE